jgi:enoyl-CoA hydratase/carnithine racemase
MNAAPRVEVRFDERAGGSFAFLTIDNLAKLNVLDSALMREFIAAVDGLAAREDLRALVVTGAGERAFIGGADIAEMAALDGNSAREFITLVHQSCDCLRRLPAPVIARIDGFALGAGLEVAVSCDLRVASRRATFGMPEVRVGLPSVVEAALIPRLVGLGRARELLMLGETIDAETALAFGLVERVVEADALDREVEKILDALSAAGPQAVRAQKALMRTWEELPVDAAIAAGIDAFVRAFETGEPKRMLSAFVNRKRD